MPRKPDRAAIARQQAKNLRKSNPANPDAEKIAEKVDEAATWHQTVQNETEAGG